MTKKLLNIAKTSQNLYSIPDSCAVITVVPWGCFSFASMEEQAASIKEIAGASDRLSELSQKLQTVVTKFQVP